MNTEKKIHKNLLIVIVASIIVSVLLNTAGTYYIVTSIEQAKVGGKKNYEILQKVQLEQIESFIKQYESSPENQKGDTGTDIKDGNNGATTAPVSQLTKEQIAGLKKDSFIEGPANAKLTIVEYSDLECPFCKKLFESNALQNVLKANKDTINYTFKHFPLDFHKNALKEAEALECAGELGGADAYFGLKNTIFTETKTNGEGFALTDLAPAAKKLGVDEKKFQACLDEGKYEAKVKAEQSNGNTLFGIDGTPGTVIINNESGKYEVISGAQGQAAFEAAIKKLSE